MAKFGKASGATGPGNKGILPPPAPPPKSSSRPVPPKAMPGPVKRTTGKK